MKKVCLLIALVIYGVTVKAQTNDRALLGIELDPAPYTLGGYSVCVRYSPKQAPTIAFSGAVFSGAAMPKWMLGKENEENGFINQKLRLSFAVFGDYFIKDNRKGFYFGPSFFFYNKSIEKEGIYGKANYSTIYPNVRAGYIWYPFSTIGLYLNPWVSAGSEINVDSKNKLGDVRLKPNKFNYIAAIHLGYSFNL